MTDARTAGALWAAVALCFPTLALAQAAASKPAPVARGATGAVVQFVETRGSAIVYLEEKGGLVSSVSKTAPSAVQEEAALPPPPPRKAQVAVQSPPKQAPAVLSRLAQRKVAPADGVATKP